MKSFKLNAFFYTKIAIVFLICHSFDTNAQKVAPNFDSEVIWTQDSSSISITIKITKGNAPFNFKLYDKLPSNGGVIIEEKNNSELDSYTFSNLELKNYILIVSDETSLRNVRPIYIKK